MCNEDGQEGSTQSGPEYFIPSQELIASLLKADVGYNEMLQTYFHPSQELVSALRKVNDDKDIEAINTLMENTNLTFLIKNVNKALDASEIDACLNERIQCLFRTTLSNGADSLRHEDVASEDIKLLRWLLKSYGVVAACK